MTSTKHVLRVLALLSLASFARAADPIPADAPARWWKGNLHTHTLWSDGNDFPEMVAEWYRDRGYNFLALSEHNVFAQGQAWRPLNNPKRPEMKLHFEKYLQRFGPNWVETRGSSERGGPLEVRLKPYSEFRTLVEERGVFLMIPGEEITNRFPLPSDDGKERNLPVHLNATNIVEMIAPQPGKTVSETIDNNLKAVHAQQERTGQEILPHLNHPNFQYAVTAEDVAHAVSDHFFEIWNGHPGINYAGDEQHASMEKLWDIANTIRLAKLNAPPLYGLGTDDSHHYNTEGMSRSIPGRGWIMVRARYLTPESLIRAIKGGDFYASSGVTLDDVRFDSSSKSIEIDIKSEDGVTYKTAFVGTPVKHDLSSTPVLDKDGKPVRATGRYKDEIGKTFATVEGPTPRYELTGDELYVRAVVTSSKPHARPVWKEQTEQAWTQPVGWAVKADGPATQPQPPSQP